MLNFDIDCQCRLLIGLQKNNVNEYFGFFAFRDSKILFSYLKTAADDHLVGSSAAGLPNPDSLLPKSSGGTG